MISERMKDNLLTLRLLDITSSFKAMGTDPEVLSKIRMDYREQVIPTFQNEKAFTEWVYEAFGTTIGKMLLEKERSLDEMIDLVNDAKDKFVQRLREKGLKIEFIK